MGTNRPLPADPTKRKAFLRLKRDLHYAALSRAQAPDAVREPPPGPAAPADTAAPPHSPPASHGTAFAVRDPMRCEACGRMVTKWLSYRPDDKTCVCWDCGIARQQALIDGMGRT